MTTDSTRCSTNKDWILVCPRCDRKRSLRAAGGVRIGAASVGKRTLAYCRQCKRLRLARVVRQSSPAAGSPRD